MSRRQGPRAPKVVLVCFFRGAVPLLSFDAGGNEDVSDENFTWKAFWAVDRIAARIVPAFLRAVPLLFFRAGLEEAFLGRSLPRRDVLAITKGIRVIPEFFVAEFEEIVFCEISP